MKTNYWSGTCGKSSRHPLASGIVLSVACLFLTMNSWAQSPAPVNLGEAGNFAVLSGAAITETTGTTIEGNVGASPITGAAIGLIAGQVNGTIYTVDSAGPLGSVMNLGLLTIAKNNLTTAYNDAAGRPFPTLIAGGVLGGLTLPPGVYKEDGAPASLGLTGTLTLDALGDPNAVWIFQSQSTLIAEVDSSIVLVNGAEACHVFWQVGSSATLKTRAIFKGVIMADQSIIMQNQATLDGQALASIGGITFDSNTVGLGDCGAFVLDVPSNTTASCDNIPAAPVVLLTEVCSTQITAAVLTETILPGSCLNSYTISRVWNAINRCGDSISSTQTISVTDTTNPVITCPPSPIVVPADANCMGTVPDLSSLVQVSDNCGTAGLVVTQEPPGGTTFFSLQINVILTATDACGNKSTCTVSIVSPCVPGVTPSYSVEKLMTNVYVETDSTNQRPAMIGEAINFVITIVNTGSIELVTIPVADTYNTNQLQYVSAYPSSVNNVNDGLINWTDVGTLAPGASTSIVVNFIAICAASGTNTVLVAPVSPFGSEPVIPLLTTAPYEITSGPLSGHVWTDLNGNGIIDEDITVKGINGVAIRLFEIGPEATTLVDEVVTATINGERGAFEFTGLPPGDYRVEIVVATVPNTLSINTTPLQVNLPVSLCGDYPDVNFGFLPATPTAVDLVHFGATANGSLVSITWETLTEWNNAGFNLYRATTPDDNRTRVNASLIPGSSDGTGQQYTYADPQSLSDGDYYYWLEDLEYDGSTRIHGPARVHVGQIAPGSTVIGSTSVEQSGLYMITADTLRRSGLSSASLDPSRLSVYVDNIEVAAYVTAVGATFADWDYVLFYANGGTQIDFGYADGEPLRMAYRFVFAEYGDGDVWTGSLTKNAAEIQVELRPEYVRYLVTGFRESTIWLIDITDPVQPTLLVGADLVQVGKEIGVYFSDLNASGIAYAAGDQAVTRIKSIKSQKAPKAVK